MTVGSSAVRGLARLSVFGWLALFSGSVEGQDSLVPKLSNGGVLPATNSAGTPKLAPLPKKDGLTAFEEELSKSLQFFSPKKGSLEGVLAPETHSPPPVIQPRPVRERNDLSKEWLLMNGDETKGERQGDEWFNFPGFNQDRKNSRAKSLEELYKRFNLEQEGRSRERSAQERFRAAKAREDEEDNAPPALRDAEHNLKKGLGIESGRSIFGESRDSTVRLFGTSDKGL